MHVRGCLLGNGYTKRPMNFFLFDGDVIRQMTIAQL